MFDLSIFRLAGALAGHSAARHALLSENVANADTPGYRAKDLESFAKVMGDDLQPFRAKVTRAGHMGGLERSAGFAVQEISAFGSEQPNGNTVTLEDQMTRSVDAQHKHQLALGIYTKSLDILRMSIGRR